MSRDWLRLLNIMQWHGSVTTIPAWEARGIRHGFLGRGSQEPSEAHHVAQVHGKRVVAVQAASAPQVATGRVEADGIYAHRREAGSVAVAVKTADCLPVLLHGGELVMAVHAGWRGFQAGILQEALAVFDKQQIPLSQVTAAIGPALSRDAFEIGPEVMEALRQSTAAFGPAFFDLNVMKGEGDRWHFDLSQAAALWLAAGGVPAAQIHVLRACTKRHTLAWHSYRREGKGAGRNWAFIQHG